MYTLIKYIYHISEAIFISEYDFTTNCFKISSWRYTVTKCQTLLRDGHLWNRNGYYCECK